MKMRTEVEFKHVHTFVECLINDPFPTLDKCRYDGCTREAIVSACVEKFKMLPGGVEAIVIYDTSTVIINGVKYESEPLNMQRWSKP